jgi:beta-glucoside kinase
MSYYVVIDIGGSSIKHSVITEQAGFIVSGVDRTPTQGKNLTIPLLTRIIEKYKKEYPLNGVGLSVPGAVDPKSGYIYFAGAVTDLMKKHLREELEAVSVPIELDNDVNCVTLAEKWKGNAQDCENFVCIAAGTGIGGGIFINGDIYRGQMGMAGEFGLMTLSYDQQLESVIDRYSFSNLGSTRALVSDTSNQLNRSVTGEEIFTLLQQENPKVLQSLDEFYHAMAIGVCNIVHAFAPEKVLIGGGISAQPIVLNEVRKRISTIRKEVLDISKIESCYFKNDAGKIGALYHFMKQQQVKSI